MSSARTSKPYLHERFNAGVTNGSQLFREISGRGCTGSPAVVRDYLRPLRAAGRAPAPAPAAPKVRTVTRWILTHPDRLDAIETATLDKVLDRSPALTAAATHVAGFAEMLVGRHGDRLDAWIAAVEADDQPDLHRFTHGLRNDHAAVLAGLTLPHSSGVVEGNVNRCKDAQTPDVRQSQVRSSTEAGAPRELKPRSASLPSHDLRQNRIS